MAKCKKSNCREEAVPFGKRYCPTHLAEYKAKQAEYLRVQATLRCCTRCGEKLSRLAHDRGDQLCSACVEQEEKMERARRQIEERARFIATRASTLSECQSVDDLKAFITRYLLGAST